jgi:hypothetical protein
MIKRHAQKRISYNLLATELFNNGKKFNNLDEQQQENGTPDRSCDPAI